MERTEEQLRQIVLFADALPVAIWVGRAPRGECVYVNREFERILGITPPEGAERGRYVGPYGVHLPTGEVYPEDQMPYERVLRARAPVVIEDLVIHRHDGGRVFLRVFASPLFDERGEISYVVEAFTDRTREAESEHARREGQRQLELAQRLEAVGGLAGGIAHDFNNLLSIVRLVASQLRHHERNPSRIELIQHLDSVADSASALTRALLGFARRGKNRVQTVGLNEIAQRVVELARRTLGHHLEVRAELGARPGTLQGDGSQLEQVLMNLLMNARDAIPTHGRITVRTSDRTFAAGEHPVLAPGRYVALEVVDDGSGIDPAILDRVFEPYVTSKVLGPNKGTGLGLATVYGIAKSHGGHAEVAATGPSGTTLRVLFPASDAPLPAEAPRGQREEKRGTGTILLVDDEPLILRTASLALQELGYQVVTASSGAEALRAVQQRHARFAAIVLDMAMPGSSPRETFVSLQSLAPTVPVLLVTGAALNEEAQQLLDLGARGFLPKPFDAAELSDALAHVVAPP